MIHSQTSEFSQIWQIYCYFQFIHAFIHSFIHSKNPNSSGQALRWGQEPDRQTSPCPEGAHCLWLSFDCLQSFHPFRTAGPPVPGPGRETLSHSQREPPHRKEYGMFTQD